MYIYNVCAFVTIVFLNFYFRTLHLRNTFMLLKNFKILFNSSVIRGLIFNKQEKKINLGCTEAIIHISQIN